MDATKTIVVFRKFKDDGAVIALFPAEPFDRSGLMCMSYMHVGQHGSADTAIVNTTKPATPAEYAPLAAELRGLGYDLDIKTRVSARHFHTRRRLARGA